VLFEGYMNCDLLYLTCRHHVHEIMLEEVFTVSVGPSSGPDIALFKQFKAFWPAVVTNDYKPGVADPEISTSIQDTASEVMNFCVSQLQKIQPRDDYRELLELVILFLSGVPTRGVHFNKPGAMHRARWMSRLIYSLKIFLFRDGGFKMSEAEKAGVAEVCIFGIQVYVKSWFLSRLPILAPTNDLMLLKLLTSLKSKTAKAALRKLCGQLWYLSEELVALSFFKRELNAEVASLSREAPDNPPKRITVDAAQIQNKQLHDFVTKNTKKFFQILSITDSFLQTDPEAWEINPDYLMADETVQNLRVVDDTAERGVALMQEYNSLLTKDEEQMQFSLQVIQEHRKLYPDSNKSTIVQGLIASTIPQANKH